MSSQRLWLKEATETIRAGMSGSPVIIHDRRAIGLVSISGGGTDLNDDRKGSPNPAPTCDLPAWLLSQLKHPAVVCRFCELGERHEPHTGCVRALRLRAAELEKLNQNRRP